MQKKAEHNFLKNRAKKGNKSLINGCIQSKIYFNPTRSDRLKPIKGVVKEPLYYIHHILYYYIISFIIHTDTR